jgi:hypothetical protein
MFRAHTVSVAIAVDPQQAYNYASDPQNLPGWALGFVHSIEKHGNHWIARTMLGEAQFRFAPFNALGVLDHDVQIGTQRFHNAMRVIPNGEGCEVLFTVLQLAGVSDEQYQRDLETVRKDLLSLKRVLESLHGGVAA